LPCGKVGRGELYLGGGECFVFRILVRAEDPELGPGLGTMTASRITIKSITIKITRRIQNKGKRIQQNNQ